MKFLAVLLLACMVGLIMASPPVFTDESNLSPRCRTPECPATGSVQLRYPLDCLLYVACENGVRTITACEPDTKFNKVTGVCEANAECVPCYQEEV